MARNLLPQGKNLLPQGTDAELPEKKSTLRAIRDNPFIQRQSERMFGKPSPEMQALSEQVLSGLEQMGKPIEKVAKVVEPKITAETTTPGIIFRDFPRQVAADAIRFLKPAEFLPFTGATMAASPLIKQGVKKAVTTPLTRKFIEKHLPTFFKKPLTAPTFTADDIAYQNWLKSPAVSPTSKELALSKVDPVNKIIRALNEAKPLRGQQEALYTEARKKLVKDIVKIGKENPGETGFYKQLSALKGELPKLQFKGIRSGVSQMDIDNLFSMVEHSSKILPFEKISAKTGLMKLLGAEGAALPTRGQIKLLETVFGPEFSKTVLAKRALLQKVGEGAAEVLNVPRALMASFDLSAPFRQGVFLVGRPKQFVPAFKDMFKFFANQKAYDDFFVQLKARPTFQLMQDAGLPLTDIGGALTVREEAFMSNLAEKLPIVGKVVQASNRAFAGFLNKLRADVFDDIVSKSTKLGIKLEGKALRDLGNFIGAATGRGVLPKTLESSAVALNTLLFSPRLVASRLNLLNPLFYARLDPFVRKEALKSLISFTGLATSIMGLAKMGGAKVSTDPRNADFGKIKIGNTRYDLLGGFQQYIRLGAQLITGEHISSTTGVKTVVGEGYKPMNRLEMMQRFLENKEAPIASFVTSALKGRTSIGEEFDLTEQTIQRITPMVIQDMADIAKERGLENMGMALPAFFGVGVQTYSPTAEDMVRAKNSVERSLRELKKQGRDEEAKRLFLRNRDKVKIGLKLEPIQQEINKLKRAKDEALKNIKIPLDRKKKIISMIEDKRKKLESFRDRRFKELK